MPAQHVTSQELDQRVTFQRRAPGTNALNEPNGAWTDVIKVWARVRPMRSRDLFAAGQAQVQADIVVAIRYRIGITNDMRMVWRGDPLEMVGEPINVEAANRTLEIMALKGARDGR